MRARIWYGLAAQTLGRTATCLVENVTAIVPKKAFKKQSFACIDSDRGTRSE